MQQKSMTSYAVKKSEWTRAGVGPFFSQGVSGPYRPPAQMS